MLQKRAADQKRGSWGSEAEQSRKGEKRSKNECAKNVVRDLLRAGVQKISVFWQRRSVRVEGRLRQGGGKRGGAHTHKMKNRMHKQGAAG